MLVGDFQIKHQHHEYEICRLSNTLAVSSTTTTMVATDPAGLRASQTMRHSLHSAGASRAIRDRRALNKLHRWVASELLN